MIYQTFSFGERFGMQTWPGQYTVSSAVVMGPACGFVLSC